MPPGMAQQNNSNDTDKNTKFVESKFNSNDASRDAEFNALLKMSGLKSAMIRKDRKGNAITKGGKKHHIMFRDEILINVVQAKHVKSSRQEVRY